MLLVISWAFFAAATLTSVPAAFLGYGRGHRAQVRNRLTMGAGSLALASLVLGMIGHNAEGAIHLPPVLTISLSVVFAIAFGGPFTELVFQLASREPISARSDDPSPLRGGLWIGLLERTAIVGTLWAHWPEGIPVVLAVKGLGRFAELKNHQAAEQFILGTFTSGLVAAGAYGMGLLLS